MSKQFLAVHVSWRDAKNRPLGIFAVEADYARAAARALEEKLNALATEGWIIDQIHASAGLAVQQTAGFTIVAFK
jgi:hypothetical protein